LSVVVSDTSPLHYLILCGAETVLPRLFSQVVIPPTVFQELQQPNTPAPVRQWAASLPVWATVQTPKTLNLSLDVDAGELEAICLACEIKASAVLMDDRAGRSAAIHCGLAVIGTIGLLEQAAARGLLDLPQVMERLRQTNARLNPDLVNAALERDKARKQKPPGGNHLT
jgi:predicted nucleic acid-binding protein